jgi:outer membrane protein OmpA-like peptidoglycan-associated protein
VNFQLPHRTCLSARPRVSGALTPRLHKWCAVAVLACLSTSIAAAEVIRFAPAWDKGWQHIEREGTCILALPIVAYGEARFVADGIEPTGFELQANKDMHKAGALSVRSYAPSWHPDAPARQALGRMTHIEGGGAVARTALAADMLLALQQGLHLELAGTAWFNDGSEVSIELAAINMRSEFASFLACAQTHIKVAWQTLSRTRITYDIAQHQLNDNGRRQLRALAQYVLQDPAVDKVFVDGHTDNNGSHLANRKLAKARATEVATYLQNQGLRAEQIVVRFHGAAYPVADNKTAQGRAQNRRTTVRLERQSSEQLASN